MDWTFKVREESIKLSSVEHLRAVFPTPEFSAKASLADYRSAFGEVRLEHTAASDSVQRLSPEDRQMFERAGWWFVSPKADVGEATVNRESVPNAQAASEVFVTKSGAVMICTNLATLKLPPDLSEDQAREVMKQDGLTIVHKLGFAKNLYEVRIPAGVPLPEAVDRLQSSGHYLWAEPTLLQTLKPKEAAVAVPGDPLFAEQWQHRNLGTTPDGVPGVAGEDLDSLRAWNITKGEGIRIAVIDLGMQINHPDLAGAVAGGGFFLTAASGESTFFPIPANPDDFPDFSHGTFCMGLAGARSNAVGQPGQGGLGSAPECSLIAIACPSTGLTTQSTLAQAVHFAVDPGAFDPGAAKQPGADVISCSLDTERPLFTVLQDAIHFAGTEGRVIDGVSRGIPIFWAVNNHEGDIKDDPVACLPEVIAVGRFDRRGLRGLGASGDELAFLAPGNDVFSTRSHGFYGKRDGTSFATALAAGVGALVLSVHRDWTAAQVRQKLRESCEPMNGAVGHDPHVGFGKLNAFMAVS